MRTRPLLLILAIALHFTACQLAASADLDSNRELVRQAMKATSTLFLEPVVRHCALADPDSSEALSAQYSRVLSLVEVEHEKIIESIGDEALQEPIAADEVRGMIEQLGKFSEDYLASVRQKDAQDFCPLFVQKLANATPESVRAAVQKGKGMIEAARARRQKIDK